MKELNTTFRLFVIEYDNDKHQYPEFDVFRKAIGSFSSREEAEQVMDKFEAEYNKTQHRSLYAFSIRMFEQKSGFSLSKSYDRLNYTPDEVISLMGGEEAWNRWCEEEKTEIEGFVEVLRENTVTLEMISKVSWLPEVNEDGSTHAWLNRPGPYTIQSNGKLSLTDSMDIFPPRFPVSEELRKTFVGEEERAYQAHCDKIKNKRI